MAAPKAIARTGVDPAAPQKPVALVLDDFSGESSCGSVVDRSTRNGPGRKGIDVEGVIGIDNGALRFRPLIRPGWGRSGIAYGPFERRNGLAFGLWISNGHNTSQAEPPVEGLRSRLRRWVLGSETERPADRLLKWWRSPQRRCFGRTLRQWLVNSLTPGGMARIDENLALGWFPDCVPGNPLLQGNALIMHALGAECGELWARTRAVCAPVLRGVQNVPLYCLVVLRETGAAYYLASIPGAAALPSHPVMRLLTVDPSGADPRVYAGIHQSVLGQIGFRVDTRVHSCAVMALPEFAQWYGSAHAADSLTGAGVLHLSPAEQGGTWTVNEGGFLRTGRGAVGTEPSNGALMYPPQPSGFVQVRVLTSNRPQWAALVWRAVDPGNCWRFEADAYSCRLSVREDGILRPMPVVPGVRLLPNGDNVMQVADDGQRIRLSLNGQLVYGSEISERRLANGTGVGFDGPAGDTQIFAAFEAHPREIPAPHAGDLSRPWFRQGQEALVSDDFDGSTGDLDGRAVSGPGRFWSRTLGAGVFRLTGERGVRVQASVARPNPGRTAYTIGWDATDFADLEVRVTPPGSGRGQNERGRGGVVFWQDDHNYITVSLWMNDTYGFSLSSFFHLNGYEELYDAVWTNIGQRVHWGVPFHLRVAFDGNHYLAQIDGESVLHRALTDVYPFATRLEIHRVGLVANWEWGNDTGTLFQEFVARH